MEIRTRIEEVLQVIGLTDRADDLAREYSGGMQRRLNIGIGLLHRPRLLILDELSSGLDPVGRHDLREALLDFKRRGKTLFFSSHELHEVEDLCDRVIIVDQGRLIADEHLPAIMQKLRETGARSLEQYYMNLIRPGSAPVSAAPSASTGNPAPGS